MKTFLPFLAAVLWGLSFCSCAAVTAEQEEDTLTFHPAVEPLELPCFGPFVRAYDGAIVGLCGKSAYRSADDGQTWKTTQALPDDGFLLGDYSIVRCGRVLVAAFCNRDEIKHGKWAEGSRIIALCNCVPFL